MFDMPPKHVDVRLSQHPPSTARQWIQLCLINKRRRGFGRSDWVGWATPNELRTEIPISRKTRLKNLFLTAAPSAAFDEWNF